MDDSCQVPQIDMTLPYPSDPVNFLDCALIPLFHSNLPIFDGR